jgi:FtsP/CotA-like multicopper oxidase with cupredoxin domain
MIYIRLLAVSILCLWTARSRAWSSIEDVQSRDEYPKPPEIVSFEINLTWEDVAPDGFTRKAILTNGMLPGPPLYLDQGDDVEFLVINNLPFAITVHFHGNLCLLSSFFPFPMKNVLKEKIYIYNFNSNWEAKI